MQLPMVNLNQCVHCLVGWKESMTKVADNYGTPLHQAVGKRSQGHSVIAIE